MTCFFFSHANYYDLEMEHAFVALGVGLLVVLRSVFLFFRERRSLSAASPTSDKTAGSPHYSQQSKHRRVAMLVRACAMGLWPAVLAASLCAEDRRSFGVWVPVLFQTLLGTMDLVVLRWGPSNSNTRPAMIRYETMGIAGLIFGLSGLVGNRPDSKYSHLFLYAVLGCLVLVLPTHNMDDASDASQWFDSVQKAALSWCISLLVAAIVFTRSNKATSAATA